VEVIQILREAQEQALHLLNEEGENNSGLRVAVIGGGCSGLQYRLTFDHPKSDDLTHRYGKDGLLVMVDGKSAEFLQGTTLTFHSTIERSGFEVQNPQATHSCGCGSSFSCE